MNHKIITFENQSKNLPSVLIYRDRDDDGNEQVIVQTFGFVDDVDDLIVMEKHLLGSPQASQDFIKDYSEESAEKFCIRQGISESAPY